MKVPSRATVNDDSFRSGRTMRGWPVARSTSARERQRVARPSSSHSRNGSFDECTMMGPSVSALNRFRASSSRSRERSARMMRASSADQSRLELTAMRASPLRRTSRTVFFADSQTRRRITGPVAAVPGRSWRNASCDPLCDQAA